MINGNANAQTFGTSTLFILLIIVDTFSNKVLFTISI